MALRGTTGAFTNAAVAAIERPSRSVTWLRRGAVADERCDVGRS